MARKQRSSISVYMPPIPKIEIRNKGNWVKVENGLTYLQPAIQHGYDIGVAKFSDKLIRIIRKAIHTHKPPAGSGVQWAPLKGIMMVGYITLKVIIIKRLGFINIETESWLVCLLEQNITVD